MQEVVEGEENWDEKGFEEIRSNEERGKREKKMKIFDIILIDFKFVSAKLFSLRCLKRIFNFFFKIGASIIVLCFNDSHSPAPLYQPDGLREREKSQSKFCERLKRSQGKHVRRKHLSLFRCDVSICSSLAKSFFVS